MDGWVAKVDNVLLQLGGFAKVENGFGRFYPFKGGVKGLINLWEKIQNGPCITTDRYPPLRHNPYQRQPEQLRRPHTLGYSSASGHLDGSWLPSAAVLRASKTIVVTIVVSLPSTGLKEAIDGGRPSIDGRQALVHAWLPPQPPSRAFF